MKTIYYTATSLDGFIADDDNSLEWLLQFGEEPVGDYPGFLNRVGAIAMGSTTYEWLLEHHIGENARQPLPWPYQEPVWVFTTRELPTVPGADIRFVRGDVRPVHAAMSEAADGKDIWIVGGGDLVGQFHDCGLLDELIVTVASVTLGSGAPLLPRAITTPPLKLKSAVAFNEDFVEWRYEVSRDSS